MVVGSPIVLNLIPGGVMPVIMINETDKGYQKEFLIYNGNAPYNVPANVSATIRGTKRDGYGVTEAADVTAGSNAVRITVTEQMTAVPGKNIFELVFVDTNGLRVGTANFIMMVERSALNENTVISESDIAYSEQVLNQLQSVAAFKEQLDNVDAQLKGDPYQMPYIKGDGSGVAWQDSYVTPEMFGAVGDGVADDTVAIQTALNNNRYVIARGTYKVTNVITLNKDYTTFVFNKIVGVGCDVFTVAGTGISLIGEQIETDTSHSGIILGEASANTPLNNVRNYTQLCYFEVKHIYAKYALHFKISYSGWINGNKFDNCLLMGATASIYFDGVITSPTSYHFSRCNNNDFDHCSFEGAECGILASKCAIYGCHFNLRLNELYSNNKKILSSDTVVWAVCHIYSSCYNTVNSAYWEFANPLATEIEINSVVSGTGGLLASKALLRLDAHTNKVVPFFNRDNNILVPELTANKVVSLSDPTYENYYGINTFILKNTSTITLDLDAPYNQNGWNHLVFIVPTSCASCVIRCKNSSDNYIGFCAIPNTTNPTVYNVYFIKNQVAYIETASIVS